MSENESLEPKIYVADLRAYTEGTLHGAWINANQTKEELREEINKMLANSPIPGGEEWAIHDYDNFAPLRLSEYEDLGQIVAIAEVIAEHGELGAAVIGYFSDDVACAKQAIEEEYYGAHESEEDFARHIMSELHDVPDYLEFYIDYDKYAGDLFINDFFSIELNGECHVFANV